MDQVTVGHETNIDKIVDKLLNDKYMTPAKIKSFSYVIQALKGMSVQEPNKGIDNDQNSQEFMEDKPFDLSEVEGIEIDGQKRGKVKIFKT